MLAVTAAAVLYSVVLWLYSSSCLCLMAQAAASLVRYMTRANRRDYLEALLAAITRIKRKHAARLLAKRWADVKKLAGTCKGAHTDVHGPLHACTSTQAGVWRIAGFSLVILIGRKLVCTL